MTSIHTSLRRLRPDTAERLACPRCRAALAAASEQLVCTDVACGRIFPIVDGVPVLIDDESSVFAIADFLERHDTTYPTRSRLLRMLRKAVPTIGVNLRARDNYQMLSGQLSLLTRNPRVLIIGGSHLGVGMEPLLRHENIDLVETDVAFGPRVAVVLDGHNVPFEDQTFDAVVAQAVLEHVADPYQVVSEIHRVLKPDGLVYAETPFMQQVHGGRYDFTRFTHLGHRRLFRRFNEISSGAVGGTGMALAWAYSYFLASFCRARWLRRPVVAAAALTSFFLKYFDYLNIGTAATLDGASGVYFLGRKGTGCLKDRELIAQYRGALR